MVQTNIEKAQNLDLENLNDYENVGLEELFTLHGDSVDKHSESYLNNFVDEVELVKLDDLTLPICKVILKNTFERYANCPLIEVERNALYPSNTTPNWQLMRRSPFVFKDVLTTPHSGFALLFESERSSAFKNIPYDSHFGVINEGSYFMSKREFKGMVLHSELFYVPLIAEGSSD